MQNVHCGKGSGCLQRGKELCRRWHLRRYYGFFMGRPMDSVRLYCLCRRIRASSQSGSRPEALPEHFDGYRKDRFQYTNIGLLDDTHIHFFARKSILPMAHQTGFVLTGIDYVSLPTGGTEQFWNEDVRTCPELMNLLRERPFGEVYQFVFSLGKQEHAEEIVMSPVGFASVEGKIYPDYGQGFTEQTASTV